MKSIFERKVTMYQSPSSMIGTTVTLGEFLYCGVCCHQQIDTIRQIVSNMYQEIMKADNWADIQRLMLEVEEAKKQRMDKSFIKNKENELKLSKQKANNATYIQELEALYKAQKRLLPSATISGIFNGGHSISNLDEHSGLICIDIDHCETNLTMEKLKQMNIVAYASRSASGNGVFCIVPLAYPERHSEQFLALEQVFGDMGIYVDDACKDVSRLRFASYDTQAFYRPDAVPFTGIGSSLVVTSVSTPTIPLSASYSPTHTATLTSSSGAEKELHKDTFERADACILAFEKGISVLPKLDYSTWCNLGMALSELGEQGRELFKRLSKVDDSTVSEIELDSKFTNFLNTTRNVGMGTFFSFCSDYGVNGLQEMKGKNVGHPADTYFYNNLSSFNTVSKVSRNTEENKPYNCKPLF